MATEMAMQSWHWYLENHVDAVDTATGSKMFSRAEESMPEKAVQKGQCRCQFSGVIEEAGV